jgi:ATP-dependent DNA helicase RecG
MAPTELLAEQHGRNFSNWFAAFDLPLTLLTGKRNAAARNRSLADLASGAAKIAIGTHALFQEGVEFQRLGLVIVDEQHRFGVHQRLLLREKGRVSGRFPHQLIMTATPIPRTLAMTAYADLDVSVIDELPPGARRSRPWRCRRIVATKSWCAFATRAGRNARPTGCARSSRNRTS